ncbi:MAG: hypothetical protein JNG89_19605 [Planctomycetaceae bacterium]|nr:hypothetical protein [Planctomycetaceae bacterium]
MSSQEAVKIARIHSPDYQEQLETIYLSALDVSTERFRFDTQFFGGTGLAYTHVGDQRAGGESNRVAWNTTGQATRQLSAAGQTLIGFANNTVWEFTGPNQGLTTSLVNFSFIQPLLRNGGRAVALERLTLAERTLLSNLRSMERYRQGFYGTVVYGDSSAGGPQRRGGFFGAGLEGFSGQGTGGFAGVGNAAGFGRGFGGTGGGGAGTGFAGGGVGNVGGYVGLLQTLQQIHNVEASLNLQLRTLALLEANQEAGLVNVAQVDQFRQSIETQRANLLQSRNALQLSLDNFKRGTLGLPPDLAVELDESYLEQFRLIDAETASVQTQLDELAAAFGQLPDEPTLVELQQFIERLIAARGTLQVRIDAVPADLQKMDEAAPSRLQSMSPADQQTYGRERERLDDSHQLIVERFDATGSELADIQQSLSPDNRKDTAERYIVLLTELQSIVSDVGLLGARSRSEQITVEPLDLTPEVALEIARANRLDWMNNRAVLVDVWRLIEFNANQLKSNLTIQMAGDVQTVRDNPLSFDSNATTMRASVQFDPPFTRLVERNVFRQQLIQYQQSRRDLIGFNDTVNLTLRQLLRDMAQLRTNLEIQRRAVAIAIRRVDQTRESLNRPVPPAQPGQPPAALGPTVAQDLLFALGDLASAQNAMASVWISYEANVMRLYRELGIMQLDNDGLWVRTPLHLADRLSPQDDPLPPEVPQSWFNELGPEESNAAENPPEAPPAQLPPADGAARLPIQSGSGESADAGRAAASRRLIVRRKSPDDSPGIARASISSAEPEKDAGASDSPLRQLGGTLQRR